MIHVLKNKLFLVALLVALFAGTLSGGTSVKPAFAQLGGGTCGPGTPGMGAYVFGVVEYGFGVIETFPVGIIATEENVNYTREWMVTDFFNGCIIDIFFKEHILPAMMMMTEQLSAVGMQQVAAIGMFMDAKHQQETQRLFQELSAQAHKDYQPSEELCSIGSVMKSLGASDRNADLTALMMTERSLKRQLGNANSNASEGPKEDREGRLEQFRRRYCDPNDNDGGLASICVSGGNNATKNKDVDYARTMAFPQTLNINFSDNTLTDDEEDVIALASNLFSHDVFTRIAPGTLEVAANQDEYLNVRSVIAKRSVAEHSFNTILGMKTAGSNAAGTSQYMSAMLQELGMSAADAQSLIGANPSYYAQMELLTKSIFQRPEFFVGLYDKPTNVARKGVALQALALMQDRDTFKSNLRSEAILSVLLEMEVMRLQEDVQNRLPRMVDSGPKN